MEGEEEKGRDEEEREGGKGKGGVKDRRVVVQSEGRSMNGMAAAAAASTTTTTTSAADADATTTTTSADDSHACAGSEDPDLALARILQEQERALYLLSYNASSGQTIAPAENISLPTAPVPAHELRSANHDHYVPDLDEATFEREHLAEGEAYEDCVGEQYVEEDEPINDNDNDTNYDDDVRYEEAYEEEREGLTEPHEAADGEDDLAYAMRLQAMEDRNTMAMLMEAQMRVVNSVIGNQGTGSESLAENEGGDEDHGGDYNGVDYNVEAREDLLDGTDLLRSRSGSGNGSASGSDYEIQAIDVDSMTYEQLTALGEVVGTASRGMQEETLAKLLEKWECRYEDWKMKHYNEIGNVMESMDCCSQNQKQYTSSSASADEPEPCPICRDEYALDDLVVILPCSHVYHPQCIREWLMQSKCCPICTKEVAVQDSNC